MVYLYHYNQVDNLKKGTAYVFEYFDLSDGEGNASQLFFVKGLLHYYPDFSL